MKIAISTVCTTELDWRACLNLYGQAGYTFVELLTIPGWKHLTPMEVSSGDVLVESRKDGVDIIALHGGALDGASDATLAQSLTYLEQLFDYAVELGVSLVNVNGGFVAEGVSATNRTEALRRIGQSFALLAPSLARRGLRLTLENHFGYQLETPDDYALVLEHVPPDAPIGVTVDTGHFTAAKVDIPAFVQAMGARVFHVHLKDHIGLESVALGAGETDNASVLRALADVGYDGYVSIEMEVHDRENAERYVREARPYVETLLAEAA